MKMLLDKINQYYTEKLKQHGSSPLGVDWNGIDSQRLRFNQVCKILEKEDKSFSVTDLGCGYGALLEFLEESYEDFTYFGVDISSAMIEAAKQRYQDKKNVEFTTAFCQNIKTDYVVASGVFNVKLENKDDDWIQYITSILDVMDNSSIKGFSFNCLTSYSDKEKMRQYLYYADPCFLFDFCKKRYSKYVSLIHDYQLYEFAILVRKDISLAKS